MNLTSHLYRQRAFSKATFGPGERTLGIIDHIESELKEIKEKPYDLYEWVDIILLALDGAWRAGHSPEAISKALEEKQEKNENREWPDWRTSDHNKGIQHVKGKE